MVIPLVRTHNRLLHWLRRYIPSEILGTTTALLAAWAAMSATGSVAVAALAATWGENVAYYGLMLVRDLRAGSCRSPREALLTLRNIVLEFGPAELLDSFLIRPAALYAGVVLLPGLAVGVLAGKLVADVIFYVPTIISYELLGRRNEP
jgi:hypothetical protein